MKIFARCARRQIFNQIFENMGLPQPAQQLKHEQQQHGAWEEQLELCDRGRLQLDAGSVKAPFSRQKSRKIATVTKAPAKKSPAARNVVTHLLIPYRRRRCAAGRNPTPHGRTCGAPPTRPACVSQPLFRYLGNGLELVELTGGGASGTPPGYGKPRAVRISTPRHGSTRVLFIVKSR